MKKYASVFCLLLLLLFCRYSESCAQAVRTGLDLCLRSAIPALFPFFVAGSLAVSSGLSDAFGKLFHPVMCRCFHLPACCAAAMVIGFLGGYPSGARVAAELYQSGQCTKCEAQAAAVVCNNTGPAFLIGMCGGGLFHSQKIGVFLYLIHISSALLTAFLLRPRAIPKPQLNCPTSENHSIPFSRCLTAAVLSAGKSSLLVSAFVLFFSVILCLLRELGMEQVSVLLAVPAQQLGLSAAGVNGILTGCMELTQGLSFLTNPSGSIYARLTAVSFLCAFGGISVLCQSAAVLAELSSIRCILAKLVHGFLAAFLCAILLFFLPTSILF